MHDNCLVIALALLVDALIGDPRRLYDRVPHPVVLIGRLIEALERRLVPLATSPGRSRLAGVVLVVAVVGTAMLAGDVAARTARTIPGGLILEVLLASTLIAARGLYDHVADVACALADNLDAARRAVAHIVGRDPQSLDGAAVARAAIESTAENFADGVVAPVLWYVAFGLPGLLAYKAINTLDSMVGHRTPRYEDLGKAAARLDDLANWIPARVAALLIAGAAALTAGADPRAALATARSDAPAHRSVNAGWPEGAMAGALGVALAGPRRYVDGIVDDTWVGSGRSDLDAGDVHRALAIYVAATALLAAAVLTVALL